MSEFVMSEFWVLLAKVFFLLVAWSVVVGYISYRIDKWLTNIEKRAKR